MRKRLIGTVASVLLVGSGLIGVAGVAAPPAGATLDANGVYTGPSPIPPGSTELTHQLVATISGNADSGPALKSTTGPYWALDTVNQHIQIWQVPQQTKGTANAACTGTGGCFYISVTDTGTSTFEAGNPSPGYGLPQGTGGTATMTGGWDAYLPAANYTLVKDAVLSGTAPSTIGATQVFGNLGGKNSGNAGIKPGKITSYDWLDAYFTTTTTTSAEQQVLNTQNWGWGYTLQNPPPYDAYTQWYDTGLGPDHYGQPGVLGDGQHNGFNDVYIPAIHEANCAVAMSRSNDPPVQGTVGVPIPAYTLSAATGDGSPVTWSTHIYGGAVPPGVTLSSSPSAPPVLSGTPQATTNGLQYLVTASDSCATDANPFAVVYNLMNYSGFSFTGIGVDNPGTATLPGEPSSLVGAFADLLDLASTFQGTVSLDFGNGSATCVYSININEASPAPPAVLSCSDTSWLTFIVTQNGFSGAPGPQGPPGATGPAGPTGPAGNPNPQTSPGGQNQQGQQDQQGGSSTAKPLTTSTPQSTPRVTSAMLQVRWSIANSKGRALKLEATTVPGGRTVNVQSCWWIKKTPGKPYHLVGCGRYPIDHVYHLTPREAIKARGYAESVWSHPLVLIG